jgi:hypothetical protein
MEATRSYQLLLKIFGGALVLLLFCFVLVASRGSISFLMPDNYQADLNKTTQLIRNSRSYAYNCQRRDFSKNLFHDQRCVLGKGIPKVLIYGDSNSAHYVGFFSELSKATGIPMRNISHNGCPPFVNASEKFVRKAEFRKTCPLFNAEIKRQVKNYDVVIISASWPLYGSGKHERNAIRETLDYLSKSVPHVVVGLKVPRAKGTDNACSAKSLKIPFMNCARRVTVSSEEFGINNYIVELSKNYPNVEIFSLREYLCPKNTCISILDGVPIYLDGDHLNMVVSEHLGKVVARRKSYPKFLDYVAGP